MAGPEPGTLTRCANELHSPDARLREEAARRIWLQFSDRLLALVESRLDPRLRRRVGADDVVQSLFGSFIAASPGPNGPPRSREDLWRLLVHFALCKLSSVRDRHFARRRDVRREQGVPVAAGAGSASDRDLDALRDFKAMTPANEAVARDEFERLLALLPEDLREVVVLRLAGYSNAEIGARIGRVERTVELKLKVIRGLLRPHIGLLPAHSKGPDQGET
jgi:DNA-directed RNA polymerase specialized sigma24 family protein